MAKSLTGLFSEVEQGMFLQGQGGLAKIFKPDSLGGDVNVTNDYRWTLAPKEARQDTPYIVLKEYEYNEGLIKRAALRYLKGAWNSVKETFLGDTDMLEPYQNLFPKDKETGFRYYFPYFSDINFQVSTGQWAALDQAEGIGSAIKGTAGLIFGDSAADAIGRTGNDLKQALGTGLATLGGYPKVGATDRPKMWESHDPRTIEIKFTLFNTFSPDDWMANRDLCTLLVHQNLYNKRDLITSLPPVFYEILVPGQHYSYASCMTDLTIINKGNMRRMKTSKDSNGLTCIVPDAYEISMRLTDMVMPSKNLFEQVSNPIITTSLQTGATQSENEYQTMLEKADQGSNIKISTGSQYGLGFGWGCWVARAVYGDNNPRWLFFREWLITESPKWFTWLYFKYGENFAKFIKDKPSIKHFIKVWMEYILLRNETKSNKRFK